MQIGDDGIAAADSRRPAPCRSWLASEGVLKTSASRVGPFAGEPVRRICIFGKQWLLSMFATTLGG